MLIRFLRAKDAVLTIFLGLALALAPVTVRAQEFVEAPAEETEMGD